MDEIPAHRAAVPAPAPADSTVTPTAPPPSKPAKTSEKED